jgi:MraZ protein
MAFRGNHPTRVDEKGRLKLPADFKRLVDEKYSTQFFITSMDGTRAQIYPMQEWQKVEERLDKIPISHPIRQRFMDRVNYYGQVVEMDTQGRLLLPHILRESAKLDGDTSVIGKKEHLEVVNHSDLKQLVEAAPWTEADAQKMADLGF